MAKTLIEARIAGRADRKRLAISGSPYWRAIDPEVHLGYRKGPRGGVWLVRWRFGLGYRQRSIATADDEVREGTLDFDAALRAARKVVEHQRRHDRAVAAGPPLTVHAAVEAYIAVRDARESARRGRQVRSDASSRLKLYVLGRPERGGRKAVEGTTLAHISLHELNDQSLKDWRTAIPETLKRSTRQRLVNDLRAALNGAYAANRARLPQTLPEMIQHGLREEKKDGDDVDPIARENQILPDRHITGLLYAARQVDDEREWGGDLFRLILTMAATGARFSQIARMKVADLQIGESRLMVPMSRKGTGGKSGFTPVPVGTDVLLALAPATKDRAPSAPLLERWRSRQVAGSIKWERGDRGPWKTASELDRPWALIRERAGLPHVVAYCLRHSSVVRGIRQNLPIRLVAALHDTSVAMIERHYGRHIADGLDELAARAVIPLL